MGTKPHFNEFERLVKEKSYPLFDSYIYGGNLTLFHVNPVANLFYVGGGGLKYPPSNFVIFEDRNLKFGDNVHF